MYVTNIFPFFINFWAPIKCKKNSCIVLKMKTGHFCHETSMLVSCQSKPHKSSFLPFPIVTSFCWLQPCNILQMLSFPSPQSLPAFSLHRSYLDIVMASWLVSLPLPPYSPTSSTSCQRTDQTKLPVTLSMDSVQFYQITKDNHHLIPTFPLKHQAFNISKGLKTLAVS